MATLATSAIMSSTSSSTIASVAKAKPRYRNRPSAEGAGLWTDAEHARFLEALTIYPSGPWRAIAAYVGTRNVRQTMTHAQKHKQKIARHERGLRTRRQQHSKQSAMTATSSGSDEELDELLLVQNKAMPLSIRLSEINAQTLFENDELVLATPMVADCLDYLVKCFA